MAKFFGDEGKVNVLCCELDSVIFTSILPEPTSMFKIGAALLENFAVYGSYHTAEKQFTVDWWRDPSVQVITKVSEMARLRNQTKAGRWWTQHFILLWSTRTAGCYRSPRALYLYVHKLHVLVQCYVTTTKFTAWCPH